MIGVGLDPELEMLLETEVDDLARYNILRYLHDHPDATGDVRFFAEQLGLHSLERTEDDLESLARCGLLVKLPAVDQAEHRYGLSPDPRSRSLVERLYSLSESSHYGEIVDRLASRSLKKAKKEAAAARGGRKPRADRT